MRFIHEETKSRRRLARRVLHLEKAREPAASLALAGDALQNTARPARSAWAPARRHGQRAGATFRKFARKACSDGADMQGAIRASLATVFVRDLQQLTPRGWSIVADGRTRALHARNGTLHAN